MLVKQIMTKDVIVIAPDKSIVDAARQMLDGECGVLPVVENDRLIGMVTDRDIVVRAISNGKGCQTAVRDVMSQDVLYCYEEDTIEALARNMSEQQIHRELVLNKDKRLVGIISLSDIVNSNDILAASIALRGISR